MAEKHRVVIVGGGFAGLYCAQALKHTPVNVTLIDKRNFHLFQPLLYQVATGSLSPGEIAAPLRAVLSRQKNTQVLLGDAVDIDPAAREVVLRDGAHIGYDTLVVATGSQGSYFGNDKWAPWAPSLKTIEDATAIRHKVLLAFEAAERVTDPDKRRAWLTFVIVGAGATGVELAGTLGEIANHTLKHDFRSIRPEDARILVIDRSPRVLSSFPEDLSSKAEKQLLKLGARVRTGITVTGVDADGVTMKTQAGKDDHIATHTVIWAAGVAVSEFGKKVAERTGAQTQRGGQINVEPDLTIPNYPDIFVLGDLAYAPDKEGKPLPGVAQVAMQGGSYAAKAIKHRVKGNRGAIEQHAHNGLAGPGQTREVPLSSGAASGGLRAMKPFHYFNKGDLAVIGRAAAVADIFGVHVSGLLAWLIWLFIHLMYLVEFQNRLLVFVEWGFLYLTYDRGARLITGSAARSSVSHPESYAASADS